MTEKRICLTPRVQGVGGMVSFSYKLADGLAKRGIQVTGDLKDTPYQAVLVIGGTRQIDALWQVRRRGVRIIQRLDGMNWLHRQRRQGWRHYLRSEYGNWILSTIRRRLVDHVIYQSQFSQSWWERVYSPTRTPATVIYNGVDLEAYSPEGEADRPQDRYRLLMVEGSLMGGYEQGLETGVRLAECADRLGLDKPVELMVIGRLSTELQESWSKKSAVTIHWPGLVKRTDIPRFDRSAHLLFSSDLNAACPNSVIEALACGLPVVSFDTGALSELVTPAAGKIATYGGNPWKLEPPDIPALAKAAAEVLQKEEIYRSGARKRAEEAFGLDRMVDGYVQVLLES